MNAEQIQLVQEATRGLKLRDVILIGDKFLRPNPTPNTPQFEARQQSKRNITVSAGDIEEHDKHVKLLQVLVELGYRIVGPGEENPPVYFEIEATFVVEYEMTAEISESAIKAFAQTNSVHNVWPFWRQHVFDIVGRGRIPHIEVPLFPGIAA